jgi:hypothetical protein
MAWDTARTFVRSLCSRDDDGVGLSRRDMLAGIGLAGLLVAAPKLLAPGVAKAESLAPTPEPVASVDAKAAEHDAGESNAADDGDPTDLSSRHWRRRRWRRRYWRRRFYGRRRYWRRRYYWRRPWRRRYWRRRYYRRVW